MLLRTRHVEPCLPTPAEKPPSGPCWLHEIKHDGYRLMARRDAAGVRLLTRNGYDWAHRFPLIAEASGALQVKSFLIDGEAVACDDNGVAVFEKLRGRREDRHVFLYAFDLIEINDHDLRREPMKSGSVSWRPSYVTPRRGCSSTSTSPSPPRSCSAMRVGSGSKAWCRSGWARAMSRGDHATGSSSRTPTRRREAGGGGGLGAVTQARLIGAQP